MKRISVIMLMLSAVVGQRLIVSSSDMEDITIDGAPAQLYAKQLYGNSSAFLISEPYSICGPGKSILDGTSFIVEHLLGLDCRIPLRLYIFVLMIYLLLILMENSSAKILTITEHFLIAKSLHLLSNHHAGSIISPSMLGTFILAPLEGPTLHQCAIKWCKQMMINVSHSHVRNL
jgi:hypothetical protein